ncbi:MAG: glycosyltransferase family 2 protein [Acetobacteraceae bacterium]|nr:glycosyltransferase family 2 protein [Acetobacteraceae bacterium]
MSLDRVNFAQARYYASVALRRAERWLRRTSDTSESHGGASFRLDKLDEKPVANVEGEIRLFISMRNELSRLPYFLSYYRAMGVGRFFFVDDRSDDGSREFILAQNDCHVFRPTNSYRESQFGLDWINALSDEYGIGHWTLTIDADELLVYPHCETVKLPDFCRYLEMTGSSSFFAFLLDMYPSENLSEAKCIPGKPFQQICPYFDKDYVFKKVSEHDSETSVLPPIRVIGGPRLRKFYAWQTRTDILSRAAFAAVESIARRLPFWREDKPHYAPSLAKVPLIKWDKGCKRITSHLAVKPWQGQLSTVTGALLHFKFFADFHDKAKKEVSRKQHYDGAQEYGRYLSHVRQDPDISFIYSGTRRFADSNTLVQIGLMQSDPGLEAYVQGFSGL